jgi:UDP-glucose 4-epimerase
MSRVLVTGGAGFIGSHVVDRLREAGHDPRIYDVRPSPFHAPGEVDTALGDVTDIDALRAAMDGCDAVMHLAAAADVGEVEKAPAASEHLNSRGTLAVLQAARDSGVRRVIYASTIWVYSDTAGPQVDETTLLAPPAHLYTATKLAGELYCNSYAELYDLQCTILRFGIPYGPRARPAAVIPAFVNRALNGEPLTIAGTGEQSRRFVYVEDLAEGIVGALATVATNRTYNLVSDEDITIKQIAETIKSHVGDVEIVHTEGRAGDFGGVEVCGARAAAELGWRPVTPFAEGVRRYIAWHLEDARIRSEAQSAAEAEVTKQTSLRRVLPAPLRELPHVVVLLIVGALTGVLAAGLTHVEALDDSLTFSGMLLLLTVAVLYLARIDWTRELLDGVSVVLAVAFGVVFGLTAITWTPDLLHLVRTHADPLALAILATTVGGGLGRRFARA